MVIVDMSSNIAKKSQGYQSQCSFQGLHLTCSIHVLVYYPILLFFLYKLVYNYM
jgi:hypothetical protein